ncbi:MAG: 5-oxoprolinase subunit PxpB [Gammaproteobacteria bacterium]
MKSRSRTSSPKVYLLGESAVVIESAAPATLACQRRIWWLAAALAHHPAVREVVPGMNNLTVLLGSDGVDPEEFMSVMQQCWADGGVRDLSSRLVEIPVDYGGEAGPDLEQVARRCGLSVREVIQRHAVADYTVYFLGFQPGFAYLGGLDPLIATPRRAEPRLAVPAGSVGIGGGQTGIYPAVTPGGWQIIGHTPLALFDPAREPPTLLLPGDQVRFVPRRSPS